MTQPNKPGPSWEEEALAAADRAAFDSETGMTDYSYYRGHIDGARWAQEKAANHAENNASNLRTAPEESEWGKIADTYFNSRFEHGRRNYDAIAPGDAWDTAIDRIARPLLARAECFSKQVSAVVEQVDELKATEAALREESKANYDAAAKWKEECIRQQEFGCEKEAECVDLRASLAEAKEALEKIVEEAELGGSGTDADIASTALAKLQTSAPAQEGK